MKAYCDTLSDGLWRRFSRGNGSVVTKPLLATLFNSVQIIYL